MERPVLLRLTLREGESERAVREVMEAFRRYPHLPMLQNEMVVYNAIMQGVREGILAYGRNHKCANRGRWRSPVQGWAYWNQQFPHPAVNPISRLCLPRRLRPLRKPTDCGPEFRMTG